jgi:glycosyltransferase involved in cell wall biosynthesis
MTGSPAISVVMPVRNAASTVAEAAESVLNQTMPPDAVDLIVIDDGSTDATPSVLRALQARHGARVRTLYGGQGLVAALNAGVAAARAPFIARMDADDIALPDRLRQQHAFLLSSPSIAVVGSAVDVFADGPVPPGIRRYAAWANAQSSPERVEASLWVESPLIHPSVMLRNEALRSAGAYRDFDGPEDYDLWLRLAVSGARLTSLPQVLLHWRDGASRLTRTDRRYRAEAFFAVKSRYVVDWVRRHRGARPARAAIWGAGRHGRRWMRALREAGLPIVAAIDIAPSRIGRVVEGIRVVAPDALPCLAADYVFVAVATPGARALIRRHLRRLGMTEIRDYLAVA